MVFPSIKKGILKSKFKEANNTQRNACNYILRYCCYYYYYYHHYYYGSTALCWVLAAFSVSCPYTQSEGLF
jgi:hypothetical protein